MTDSEIGTIINEFINILNEFVNGRNLVHIVTVKATLTTLAKENDCIQVEYNYIHEIINGINQPQHSRLWILNELLLYKDKLYSDGYFKSQIESLTIQDIHNYLVTKIGE